MPTVLVYRSRLLPYSETFIKEQMLAYRSWRGILAGKQLANELALDGLDVRLLGDAGRSFASRSVARVLWSMGRPSGLRRLRQEAPSLLHAHFGFDAIEAAPLARALRIPLAVTLHGYDINIDRGWWERGNGGPAMKHYPRRLLDLASQKRVHFIAVSDAIRQRAIAYGIPSETVTTLPIGIDVKKFIPGATPIVKRGRRILFVGRLVEKKGCGFLLRAIPLVKNRVPDVELAIVGDGPLRPELERLARELGLPVRFHGALGPMAIKSELDQARVFCLPSTRAANGDAEGLPIVLLEAQAAGLPVVASQLGGVREAVVNGKTGYSFVEKDIGDLACRLTQILTDDQQTLAMASEARDFVCRHFDLSVLTGRLEKYYDELTSSGHA
jgi:glycosyltransferase involved in cell wall biosynthesis